MGEVVFFSSHSNMSWDGAKKIVYCNFTRHMQAQHAQNTTCPERERACSQPPQAWPDRKGAARWGRGLLGRSLRRRRRVTGLGRRRTQEHDRRVGSARKNCRRNAHELEDEPAGRGPSSGPLQGAPHAATAYRLQETLVSQGSFNSACLLLYWLNIE